MQKIDENLITVAQYAKQSGVSPQNIYQRIERNKKNNVSEIVDHVLKIGKNTYLDETAVHYLDSTRRDTPMVIDSKELQDTVKELRLQLQEVTEDRDNQRNEKEAYMKQLLEIQQKGIDTSKYIALEDHRKTEEALKEKEEELEKLREEKADSDSQIEDLKEKNEQLKEDSLELRSVTIRVSKLNNEIEEKRSLIEKQNNEMLELQKQNINIEAEKRRAEEDVLRIEAEKKITEDELLKREEEIRKKEEEIKQKEQESLENLSLGFFARRKKLKEIKKRMNNQER